MLPLDAIMETTKYVMTSMDTDMYVTVSRGDHNTVQIKSKCIEQINDLDVSEYNWTERKL